MNTRTRFDVAFPPKNPNLALTTNDINSKRTFFYEKPDFSLRVDDIDGARPKRRTSHLGKRCVNPLNPEYTLPSYKPVQPIIPRFRRCNIQIKDIEKTQPASLPKRIRSNNYGDKIIGRSRRKAYKRTNTILDSLDVSDINNYHIGFNAFRTTRPETNPNDPVYSWDKRTSGHVKGSTSKVLHRNLKKQHNYLSTQDISGAEVVHDRYRRNYTKTFQTLDIDGAQASTTGRDFSSKSRRCTNPLTPKYETLDTPPASPEKS